MDSNGTDISARQGLSAFSLKIAAIVGMTCNHAGYVFYPYLPFGARCVMLGIGGVTFPIMAFLLVEGYRHTSNLKRYAGRLAVFAVISQLPYGLFLARNGNVLITLLLCLVSLYLYDRWFCERGVRGKALFCLAFACILALSALCDWGVVGPVMVLVAHIVRLDSERKSHASHAPHAAMDNVRGTAVTSDVSAVSDIPAVLDTSSAAVACSTFSKRESRLMAGPSAWRRSIVVFTLIPIVSFGLSELQATAADIQQLPFLLYALVGNTTAMLLLLQYNGSRGASLKWFFYAYYPAHIAVLGLAKGLLLGDWSLGF